MIIQRTRSVDVGAFGNVLVVMGVVVIATPEPHSSPAMIGDPGAGFMSTESDAPTWMFRIDGRTTDALAPGTYVDELTVSVDGVDAPRADRQHPCSPVDFVVRPLGSVVFPMLLQAESAQTLSSVGVPRSGWPAVGMVARPVNQDGCQGPTVELVYTGSATTTRTR